MAITTYSELQSAISNWLDHQLFTARVTEFITLFEAAANRRLRVRQQETSIALSISSNVATLPTDYLAWHSVLVLDSTTYTIAEHVTPQHLYMLNPTLPDGVPTMFSILGTTITVAPDPTTQTVTLRYYAKVPALSDSATTNWLLTAHPDLYLFGSLVEAEMFGVNDQRMPLWKARRDEIFTEIERLGNKSKRDAIQTGDPEKVPPSRPAGV